MKFTVMGEGQYTCEFAKDLMELAKKHKVAFISDNLVKPNIKQYTPPIDIVLVNRRVHA